MALSSMPSLPLMNVDVSTPITEKWRYTQIENEKFSFTWTLKNFNLLDEKTKQFLVSPEFSVCVCDNDEYKWQLKIHLKGASKALMEFLSVSLCLRSCHKSTAKHLFKLAILNSGREVHQFEIKTDYGFAGIIKRDLLLKESNRFLPKDTLTILFEGSILTKRANTSSQGHRSKITFADCRLSESEDFRSLIANGNFSDVILEVDGHEIKAQKAILSSRSDVFAAMFKNELEENKSNRVSITDVDYEVLKEMLCFIYSGTVSNLKEIANDLYAAADKYALEKLKEMCEIALLENLSVETAAETLILAFLHSSVQMKAETINFIKSHITDIMKTKGWLDMMTSNPDLVAEIIQ